MEHQTPGARDRHAAVIQQPLPAVYLRGLHVEADFIIEADLDDLLIVLQQQGILFDLEIRKLADDLVDLLRRFLPLDGLVKLLVEDRQLFEELHLLLDNLLRLHLILIDLPLQHVVHVLALPRDKNHRVPRIVDDAFCALNDFVQLLLELEGQHLLRAGEKYLPVNQSDLVFHPGGVAPSALFLGQFLKLFIIDALRIHPPNALVLQASLSAARGLFGDSQSRSFIETTHLLPEVNYK